MKLNLACGRRVWDGFDNSDIHGAEGTSRLDIGAIPWPLETSCAELILISHSILMTNGGAPVVPVDAFVAESARVLKRRGWLRIDEHPLRLYGSGVDVPHEEREQEAQRGYPDDLRISFDEMTGMLSAAGFNRVVWPAAGSTVIPGDEPTRYAIVHNHDAYRWSVAVEAQRG